MVIMVYKIIHGLVAIPIPSYFEQPLSTTRHTRQPLVLSQINTTANYYKFSFFPLNCCLLESTSSPDSTTANSGSNQCCSAAA